MLEQAESERLIVRQCMAHNLPLPEKIKNAPVLWIGLQLYWTAFFDLTTCRSSGLTVAPIPWSVMKDYAIAKEFDADQTESLFYLIRAMDNAYMDFRARKQE